MLQQLLAISAIILLSVFYWRSNLHTSVKFTVYIKVLIAILTLYAIFIAFQFHNDQVIQDETVSFEKLSSSFYDDVVELFIKHPEMNYYYKELMNLPTHNNRPVKRNILLENKISMLIFSKLSNIVQYTIKSESESTVNTLNLLECKTLNILNIYFKSKIFRDNWKIYKERIACDAFKEFIQDKYNL